MQNLKKNHLRKQFRILSNEHICIGSLLGMALTNTEAFKAAAGYAKAVASLNDLKELSPLVFLAGVYLALNKNAFNEEVILTVELSEKILAALKEDGHKLDEVDTAHINQTFPINSALKQVIGECQKSNINDFILKLAESVNLIVKTDSEEAANLDAFFEDPIFQAIDRYAQGLSKKFGFDENKPELYAMGALVALNNGDLAQRPALSAHINAYAREFKAWIDHQGWQSLDDLKDFLDAENNQQISATHPLHSFSKARNPLIALLNAGIENVTQIRATECVAYHEAGHAVISLALRPKVQLDKVTIVPNENENYDGCTFFSNPIYKHLTRTREDILEDLCVALAGQAAQLKKYGFNAADVGAVCDFAGATEYAWQYITEYGLDDSFGPVQLSILSRKFSIKSGWLFDEAQKRLQSLLKEAQQKTEILLEEHWDNLERVVEGLLERKTLDEDEVRALLFPAKS